LNTETIITLALNLELQNHELFTNTNTITLALNLEHKNHEL
jgi:hypothetical protein